jgi:hypothetical protein
VKLETLANGFRVSGLYPVKPNTLDYIKCLGTSTSASASIDNSLNTEDELGTTMHYSTFVEIIGKEKIEKLKKMKYFMSGKH